MISFISAGELLNIMILSDINKASSILCVINKIDCLYCVHISSNHFCISVRVNSSKAENGSSKQSISCGHIKARINDTRRSEEHTSELQSRGQLVCSLLLE